MILITGFEPFGGDKENPSRLSAKRAVSTLLSAGIPAAFLEVPVVFKSAGPTVLKEIERLNVQLPHDPVSVVICCGVAGGRSSLSLETTAVNLESGMPDNDGDSPSGRPVIPDSGERAAPVSLPAGAVGANAIPEPNTNYAIRARSNAATLSSRLPLEKIYAKIRSAGIKVDYSNDAGLYVCNSLFYYTLHEIPQDVQVGFIHVPHERRVSIEKQAEGLVIAAKVAAGYEAE